MHPSLHPIDNRTSRIDFGQPNNIPIASGAYCEVWNPGMSTICFHITPPNNGWVQYQGTFDGINYTPITLRQVGDDGYSQESSVPEDYIGSVIGLKSLRFVNMTGASAVGTVMGTFNRQVSTLEGIENDAPPHKFGNSLFHLGINITGAAVADQLLYHPSSRHKVAITHISMGTASTNGSNITVYEGSGMASDPNRWVFSTYVKAPVSDTVNISPSFLTPWVSQYYGSGIYITTDGVTTVRGVVHGYQTEN